MKLYSFIAKLYTIKTASKTKILLYLFNSWSKTKTKFIKIDNTIKNYLSL